ncbi:MAG: TerB family tellurite resistance protein [Candidatus Bipolaricaulia bacterium]
MFNLRRKLGKRGGIGRAEPTEQDQFERLQVATCVLLLEVARSDEEFSSIEKATIRAILEEEFRLSDEAVEGLMEVARKRREGSVDLWEFTHLINENYSLEEKIKVIEAAWRIIYADERLDEYEDHLVHKLAGLLRLRHRELIEAKLRVLEELKPGRAPGPA